METEASTNDCVFTSRRSVLGAARGDRHSGWRRTLPSRSPSPGCAPDGDVTRRRSKLGRRRRGVPAEAMVPTTKKAATETAAAAMRMVVMTRTRARISAERPRAKVAVAVAVEAQCASKHVRAPCSSRHEVAEFRLGRRRRLGAATRHDSRASPQTGDDHTVAPATRIRLCTCGSSTRVARAPPTGSTRANVPFACAHPSRGTSVQNVWWWRWWWCHAPSLPPSPCVHLERGHHRRLRRYRCRRRRRSHNCRRRRRGRRRGRRAAG